MTTLQVILLTIIIIVLHVQAGMVWEMYFRQEDARKKNAESDKSEQVSKEQQNSEEIVNANTRTFAILDAEQVSKEDSDNEQE